MTGSPAAWLGVQLILLVLLPASRFRPPRDCSWGPWKYSVVGQLLVRTTAILYIPMENISSVQLVTFPGVGTNRASQAQTAASVIGGMAVTGGGSPGAAVIFTRLCIFCIENH